MKRSLSRILPAFLLTSLLSAACGGAAGPAPASAAPAGAATPADRSAPAEPADPALAELRLDYATYSPPSLVLKKMGWVEQAFPGTTVKWVYSAGSSNALNFLQGNAVDFGSTAGSAALLSRANGNPIKAVYVYEQPEWTALVVAKDSPAKTIADLKGRRIAAQKGTDPYFFLLRTLNGAGLSQADIQYVNLPHAEGRTALERGQVDAWAGLDPHMAASELQAGSRLIYRNKDFNTYGFLNSREAFLKVYPATTRTLIGLYERAKQWIVDHPDEAAKVLADEAQITLEVAKRELNDRMNFKTSGIPGDAHVTVLKAVVPIIAAEQLANPGANLDKAVTDLIDGSYAKAVIK
ncbi:MAG TPA: aliphatic sulfonate ABC transporter substrate-binding protein [Candidatus Saccharimonadales bacterium]|nr:aliphatic sulfonate ABC transporter substrate-binding protein [Candidatus Saccharimonadales bacterium]